MGTVQYLPAKSCFVWKMKQLGGGREFLMRAHFGLPSVRGGKPYSVVLLDHTFSRKLFLCRAKRHEQTGTYHLPF